MRLPSGRRARDTPGTEAEGDDRNAPGSGAGSVRAERSRSASRSLQAHLETWRPYTLAYPGLVGLAGAALGDGRGPGQGPGLLVAWGAPTLGWISGHYLGDWFDRELDAIAKPQRPLPSGRLSPRTAVAGGVACVAVAAVAAASVNWRTVLLVAVALLGIIAYSRVFKGRGLTGNAVRGSLTATTVVFGAMAVAPLPSWQVLVCAGAFWAQDTASNLVGTLRDVEGDRAGGCRTLPVRHGVRAAVRTAAALHAVAPATVLALLLTGLGGPEHLGGAVVLLGCAAACGVAAFCPLLRSAVLTPRRALRSHEVLVAQRLLLAGALLAAGWSLAPALGIVGPLLGLSLYAQARMRSRHEFPGEGGA